MSHFTHHGFFCTNQRPGGEACCNNHCATELRAYAKDRVKALGTRIPGRVRINTTDIKSYNLCSSNATTNFVQGTVSLAAYAGQTVTLRFRATTDASYSSSFYIDDVALTVPFIGDVQPDVHAGSAPAQRLPKPSGVEPAPERSLPTSD